MPRPSSYSSGVTNARFVEALRAGDVGLFEQLYREWFHDLAKYVTTFVQDDDAGDVVQDVFLSLWRSRDRIVVGNDQELFHYLLRAVRNRALDLIRHERVKQSYALARPDDNKDIPHPDPDTDTEQGDLLAQVGQVIEALPARSREVLVLRWYHGLGFEQIASVMGISYGSAHVLHSRALALVRRHMNLS